MDSLGDRMKKYEDAYEQQMINRLPIVIRCDGKNFSNWTKKIGAVKPFDSQLSINMSEAMRKTAEKIEGCLFGFTQSDEITFVLRNDQSLESTPWFDNRIQKMCSIVSSILTANFNKMYDVSIPLAYFDTRVFAVPTIQEAINALVWRQNDAVKNSISCSCYYGSANIIGKKTARKMMEGLNQNQQQEMLFREAKINWNDYPTKFKRGIGCYKQKQTFTKDGKEYIRTPWIIDEELPTFSKDHSFLLKILSVEKDI